MTTANVDTIRTFLDKNWPSYKEMLRQMVEINSFTANPAGINHLGEVTAEMFAELGFSAEYQQSQNPDYGRHLILTKQGTGKNTVGLVSHLDTVFPEADEIANDFHWRIEGDRIYGPGTNDIKGGTVMVYMLLAALKEFSAEQYDATTWVILVNASEETLGTDFGELVIDRLRGCIACLIFEAGQFNGERFMILTARKGMASYRVTTEGKAAHAGGSHPKGANAIVQMADVIQKIAGFTDYDRELTFNVGTVSGGTVTNRVPHSAEIKVEMRTYEPTVFEDGVSQMMALNDYSSVSSAADGYPCKVTVELLRTTQPWPANDWTEGLYLLWEAAGAEVGHKVIRQQRGGLSDGNMFFDVIPTIDALGPHGANAHCSERSDDGTKDQEYATESSFVPKALLNVVAVLKLLEKHS